MPEEIPEELLAAQPWLNDHRKESVTALEILHGVLRNPKMAEHAYFYFRDPGYAVTHAGFIRDVFSRYVTGWMIAYRKSGELARQFIEEAIDKHQVPPGQLTIHADRGRVMKSKPVAFLMADLGVTKSHSRPYVSDDNPYSESQFRTMKYRPEFPDRFGCIQDSRAFCQQFFPWYNEEHRHSGIALLTPAVVHFGETQTVLAHRQVVLDAAYQAHPDRFVRRPPKPLPLPSEVWINKPVPSGEKTKENSQ